jgi:hypothetical protein
VLTPLAALDPAALLQLRAALSRVTALHTAAAPASVRGAAGDAMRHELPQKPPLLHRKAGCWPAVLHLPAADPATLALG